MSRGEIGEGEGCGEKTEERERRERAE